MKFSSVIFFLSCGLITGVWITSLFFENWFINEFVILSLFLSCYLRNDICSTSWFINLSDISYVKFSFTCSQGLCSTHDCKNLKFLTSVKNELSIFLNSPNICSLRFPISSIKTGFSWFSSFCINFWFSFGSDKHSRFLTILSRKDWFWINSSKILSKVSLVTSSTESLNKQKTSSFPHFLFPRFSVCMEAIINISSSLSSTVGVLRFNVAGELTFNEASWILAWWCHFSKIRF